MKETYQKLQSRITADEALIERTLAAAELRPKRRPIRKYIGIAAAAACIAMVGSVPVLAENVPAFYQVLYKVMPETAWKFRPIQMADEDQGIRMEVEAVKFSEAENSLEVYFTLRDLTGDRLNTETGAELFGNLRPEGEYMTGHGERTCIEYNESTGIMSIITKGTYENPDLNTGDKMTFKVSHIWGGPQIRTVKTDVKLSDLTPAIGAWKENTPLVNGTTQSGNHTLQRRLSVETEEMIKPSLDIAMPADGVRLTGLGYIRQDTTLYRNECHVQLYHENTGFEKTAVPVILMSDGTELRNWGMISSEEGYTDYLFMIKEEELQDAELYLEIKEYESYIPGEWSVTFEIPEDTEMNFPQG